ncbi:MAG: amidohydrolase, partial [Proteobacteria bacterium]|nr:amidohydrolase [Pseudomonadota bacterium]
MPIVNRVAGMKDEIAVWRRDFHEHPEILYEVHRTAGIVAEKLREFGCDEVTPGIGRTGVVAVIKGRSSGSGKVIGMRADMDALPMQEKTGLPHASKTPGAMHACGHDGHTAMLLGAAKYLAETRNFDGTVVLIFQPAEEGGAGGLAMVKDGLMDRWGIQEVYAMHSAPGIPVGHFALRPGPMLAAADRFVIDIAGEGAHAARPHLAVDPIVVGCQLHAALQTIVARNVDPLQSAVVSITMFNAGEASNVIPDSARLEGTVRTLSPKVRKFIETRFREIAAGVAAMHGAKIEVTWKPGYPVTVNHEAQAGFVSKVAREISGP